jgi:hypothetical protein
MACHLSEEPARAIAGEADRERKDSSMLYSLFFGACAGRRRAWTRRRRGGSGGVATAMAIAATIGLSACGAPVAPRNRAGVFAAPIGAGGEYEHFIDGDADHGSWSVGMTAGLLWDADDLLAQPRHRSAAVLAINPLVRWHAFRPTDWLTLGLDGKLSFLWFMPDRDIGRGRFTMALESHASVAVAYQRVYALVGLGVKQFMFSTPVDDTRFPNQLIMPASEASLGVRW